MKSNIHTVVLHNFTDARLACRKRAEGAAPPPPMSAVLILNDL